MTYQVVTHAWAPVALTLIVCAVVGRRIGGITPRTAAALQATAAALAATYAYITQDWPWDAINTLITLILTVHWATYPTKRERREQESQR